MRNVQSVVHVTAELDQAGDLFIIGIAFEMHVVGDNAVSLLRGFILGIESDDLWQVHGIGSTVNDVCAVIGEDRTGLVSHGVDDA